MVRKNPAIILPLGEGERAGQAGWLHGSPGQNRGTPPWALFVQEKLVQGPEGMNFPAKFKKYLNSVSYAFGPIKEVEEKSIFLL